MAQTIQVKRSTATAAPATLANGELAYSHVGTTGKLFIGRPGGAVGDIDAIGGKYYVDRSETAYGWGDHALAGYAASSSLANYLPLSGGTMTGNITLPNNGQLKLSNTASLYSSGDGTFLSEFGAGNLELMAKDIYFRSDSGGSDTDYFARFIYNGGVELYYDGTKMVETTLAGFDIAGNLTLSGTVDGRDVATDGIKLDGIEAGANVTDTANVTAAGALMDSEVTNLTQVKAFDSADYATAAQGTKADNALPKSGGAMTGAITTTSTFDGRDVGTDGTKLDGIEAGANVTDTANVTAAGALMDSEVINLAQVKAFDSSDYATAAQGTTADNALPKAGGALTGAVTTTSTFDGRDVSVDGAKLDTIATSANNYTLANLNAHLAGGVGNIVTSGYIRGPAAMVIDPAAHGNDTGALTILGDLIVEGTTTTINSTVVETADERIELNSAQTGTPTSVLVAGITVNRGTSTAAHVLWRESLSGWYVSDGGPADYEVLHANNWSTAYTGVVDGGSF